MKVLATFVALLGACALATASDESVPALLWGNFNRYTPVAAIHKYTQEEFGKIVESHQTPDTKTTVIFIEPNLSATDLSRNRASFANLQRTPSKLYLSSVQQPLAAIEQLSAAADVQHLSAADALAADTLPAARFVYIALAPATIDETPAQLLAQHDAQIAQISAKYTDGQTLFVYTGQAATPSALRRTVRQSPPAPTPAPTPAVHFRDDRIMLYYTNLTYDDVPVKIVSMTTELHNGTQINVTLTGEQPADVLNFVVETDAINWWTVSHVQFRGQPLYDNGLIGAPPSFSFHCAPASKFSLATDHTKKLLWSGLQLEGDFQAPGTSFVRRTNFSEPWDCVGFVSQGMLGGFFVTLLMLVILAVGISWIMDIRTMDRFDDPKGKPIVVGGANE